ncbi:MAG TPA: UDP-N-acetylmuramate--L-alanine ligase [Planctomycetes bacterium]|nr:UDP-N-acetylmuramate--L-alanine ligase [Planctomycetota bacterium]HIJ72028.1 UDP-N-acetylmuramate--L-alanine ligase [Planctomycetota bacterium]
MNNSVSSIAGRRYHFIGAGGIGMSGLAKVLIKNGATVTGSDKEHSPVVENLLSLGADIRLGHDPENLRLPVEAVVISAAIKPTNPELVRAKENDCKIYKYAEMLGLLLETGTGIAVCGTHGKSTTSGWLAFILEQAGLSPSFIIGADVPQLGGSSGVGDGEFFVAEACEYDRSFLNLHPRITVMLNIEQDHLDYYKDEADIVDAFSEFAACLRPDGLIIANGTDRNIATVLSRLENRQKYVTFGLDADCDFYADNIELVDGLYNFDVFHKSDHLGAVGIALPGEHNILNALAVVAGAVSAGVAHEVVLQWLGRFEGVDRRLMLRARVGGVTILDDYAHHPTEIKASLRAIRQRYEPGRIWCVFQPHQYSRTRFLLDDFAESFTSADVTIVPQIYFVRDTAEAHRQINAQVLVDRIRAGGCEAVFINDFGRICEYLNENVKEGDLIVTMGAGDIWKVADEYIQGAGAYNKTELSSGRLHMVRPGRKC